MASNKIDSKTAVHPEQRWLNFILDSADFTIISTDQEGVIRSINAKALEQLGYQADELIDKQTPAIIHDGDEITDRAAQLSLELGETIEPGFEVFVAKARRGIADENEWTYIGKDGSRYCVLLSVTALNNDAGELEGFLGIGRDITQAKQLQEKIDSQQQELSRAYQELQKTNQRLVQICKIDPLTELLNRRGLHDAMIKEFERIHRHPVPMSIIILDMDHFKSYNDTYGHIEGDEILKQLARMLRHHIRSIDSIARFGGGELLIMLPNVNQHVSMQIAERYRELIVEMDSGPQKVTASFGVATLSPGDLKPSYEEVLLRIIAQADQAMYASKADGRNTVTHFHDLQQESSRQA